MLMFMDPKAISTNCIVSPDGDNYKAVPQDDVVGAAAPQRAL